jgi:hypothetical protein
MVNDSVGIYPLPLLDESSSEIMLNGILNSWANLDDQKGIHGRSWWLSGGSASCGD